MAVRDLFHQAVRKALEKEGWSITHDPLTLQVGGVEMSIDLGAEQLLAAEKEGQKIAVEIKSFVRHGRSMSFTWQWANIAITTLRSARRTRSVCYS
jgi:hypothetical protein